MIILTCANRELETNVNKKKLFSFRAVIEATARQARKCGYQSIIFDLGNLGLGERHIVEDVSFNTKGFYEKEPLPGYKTKSLFKPEIVQIAMARANDVVVYLDGDAQLNDSIDEIIGDDYDVGVTLRPKWEIEGEWHRRHQAIVKYINAGVIIFNPTEAAKHFVDVWKRLTNEVGNDQMALNQLACSENHPNPYSVEILSGVRIKYFPCERYNFYFFGDFPHRNAKILHFKGNIRHFFPFTWLKQFYCYIKFTFKKAP